MKIIEVYAEDGEIIVSPSGEDAQRFPDDGDCHLFFADGTVLNVFTVDTCKPSFIRIERAKAGTAAFVVVLAAHPDEPAADGKRWQSDTVTLTGAGLCKPDTNVAARTECWREIDGPSFDELVLRISAMDAGDLDDVPHEALRAFYDAARAAGVVWGDES